MENCAKSEMVKTFEEKREQFTPYGFTCEIWTPKLMNKFDRHNEVEINFIPSGVLTYLFHNHTVSIPAGKVALFWGLYPHRVIGAEDINRYYVVTIPLGIFLKWHISTTFIDRIMKGEVIIERNPSAFDSFLFKLWHENLSESRDFEDIVSAEIHCRVRRLERSGTNPNTPPMSSYEGNAYDYIERMAMYISSNYDRHLTVGDVAKSVGLNPDYANNIFKRTFCHPISEHIAMERIAKAQRMLLFSSDQISSIAYEVGYESLSSFNRTFKRLTGFTPRAYRSEMDRAERR